MAHNLIKENRRPPANDRLSLDGGWQFALDPADRGRGRNWFARRTLPARIRVPGSWQAQGFGGEYRHIISQTAHPPVQVERHGYRGTAWYAKTFCLPPGWQGRRIWLLCGGVQPRAEFWCDGRYLGQDPGGLLEFKFDLTPHLRRAAEHCLVARVFEDGRRWDMACEGGVQNWAVTWSGLYRSVALAATGGAWIDNLSVLPDLRGRRARVRAALGGAGPLAGLEVRVAVAAPDGCPVAEARRRIALRRQSVSLALDLPIVDPAPWSLESPQLYRLRMELWHDGVRLDERAERFGMRDITVQGRRILLNGRPVFLRGFGWNMIFPRTLSPDLDGRFIRKQLRTARAYGFNAMDIYGVPYREFLDAADETGILLQVFPGDLSGTALTRRPHLERLMRQAINHPSIIAYGWSAERYDNTPALVRNLDRLYTFAKRLDPTRLSLARDGSHLVNVGHGRTDFEELACCYRGCYPDKMLRRRTGKPVLLHELGWFSSYPNPALKPKYRNLPLLPFQITLAEQAARRQGVSRRLPVFVRNSERLQAMERKMALEELRKVPAIAGFHLWMGHDTVSGVEGVWDDFGEPKNVSAREFLEYNGDTVLLLNQDCRGLAAWVAPPDDQPETNPHDICRAWQGRNLWAGEILKAGIWLSHYGARPIRDGVLSWTLSTRSPDRVLAQGRLTGLRAPCFTVRPAARLRLRIPELTRAVKMTLRLRLQAPGAAAENSWDFWGFPRAAGVPADKPDGVYAYAQSRRRDYGVDLENAGLAYTPAFFNALPQLNARRTIPPAARLVVSRNVLSNGLLDYLEAGGAVWLLTERLFPEYFHRFRSIPWNQAPFGSSGTIVQNHPCLKNFPHEGFCDLQFYDLARTIAAKSIADGGAVNLDLWPGRIEPIICPIDSFMGARRSGLLFEARVGRGRLLVSRLNFVDTPAARFLAAELVRYMVQPGRRPAAIVPAKFLRGFVNMAG